MFIQTEATPDPLVMKFFPGQTVLDEGRAEFPDAEAAHRSPLARYLFDIDGVVSVALDGEYVTVTKDQDLDWNNLKTEILGTIMDHFMAGRPVMEPDTGASPASPTEEDAPHEAIGEIKELIDTRILPAVMQSGGGISFHSFVEGTVYLEFSGSAYSMIGAIENMLRHYVPSVAAVRDYSDVLPKPGLDTEIGQAVARVVEERINPSVAGHGGSITLVDVVDDTKVFIRLEGGCQGCGMASVTLKQGIEVEIKDAVPQITDVFDVTDHAGGDNPYYQSGQAAPHL